MTHPYISHNITVTKLFTMEKSEKNRKKPFLKSVCVYFREYCNSTGIHGFRYFGEKRTIFERVWWAIVFVFCLAVCTYAIYGVYKKWEESPVIVNFANRGTPIYKIPFPAVTICPESKSKQHLFSYMKIFQKIRENETLTEEESTNFEYMSLICRYDPTFNYSNPDYFPDDFFEVVDKIKSQAIFYDCHYLGTSHSCYKLFTPILTDEGVCYTFNMLDRSDLYKDSIIKFKGYQHTYNITNWSVEDGFTSDATETYPARALFSGAPNGLTFSVVTPFYHLDYTCHNFALQGYKVILHSPIRVPRPSQQYFRVPLDQSVVGAVQPVMISTSNRVKMYNPQRRGCYFPSERNLTYFKIYSFLNCKLECLTKHTLESCGCVNFYMPRENGTKLCGTGKIQCMKSAEEYLQAQDLYQKMSEKKPSRTDCDCLPICTDVTYEVETSQSDWDWKKVFTIYGKTIFDAHLSSVTIFFKSDSFVTSERNELYGPIDFLANFGGILGLFTGFSIISFIEILYFLSVRLICNSRLYGYWAGDINAM